MNRNHPILVARRRENAIGDLIGTLFIAAVVGVICLIRWAL